MEVFPLPASADFAETCRFRRFSRVRTCRNLELNPERLIGVTDLCKKDRFCGLRTPLRETIGELGRDFGERGLSKEKFKWWVVAIGVAMDTARGMSYWILQRRKHVHHARNYVGSLGEFWLDVKRR